MSQPQDLPHGLSTPTRLVLLLEQEGWRLVGGQEGFYLRLQPSPEGDRRTSSLVIPTDPEATDYEDLMASVVRSLAEDHADIWRRTILPRLAAVVSDAFRFRKDTAAPSGLIAWDDGQSLIMAARATLAAGAKFYVEPSRYFSNRGGRFAARYLDSVLMGQTDPGSYVITAFAPTQTMVPLHGSESAPMEYAGIDAAPGRAITNAVARAVRATTEALREFRAVGSLNVFDEAVSSGISYEMVSAVGALAAHADESSISIEWEATERLSSDEASAESYEFTASDVPVLEKAATRLITVAPIKGVRVLGRVHLLTRKQAGGPGVVGVDDGKRKYRVRFDSESAYHEAVQAHDRDQWIEVRGELSREGTLSWLYVASLLGTGPPPGGADGASTMPGLFDRTAETDL